MKPIAGINFAQRPESYWAHENPLQAILQNVKGTKRREAITDYWNAGNLEELAAELLNDTLTEDIRTQLGQIHPAFMGGEYLSDYLPDEVEVARIKLESVTGDVVSIRARRQLDGITYRIVDEYDTVFCCQPDHSRLPLTLAEITGLIEEFIWLLLEGNDDLDEEVYRSFVTMDSAFYAELEDWWQQRLEQRIAERKQQSS